MRIKRISIRKYKNLYAILKDKEDELALVAS